MSSTIRPDPQSGVSLVELLTGMTVAVLLVGSTLTGVVSHQNQRRVHSERILAMAACRNTMATLRSVDFSTLPTPWTSQAFADAVVAADREDDAATALDQVPARALDDQTRTRLWAVATGLGPDELRMSALAMLERSGDKTPLPADVGDLVAGAPLSSGSRRPRRWRSTGAGSDGRAGIRFGSRRRVIAGQALMAASKAARLPPQAPRQRWDDWLAARAQPRAAAPLPAPPH